MIGYARPSEKDSACEEQRLLLKNYGCNVFYVEGHAAPLKRVELDRMIAQMSENDVIVVENLHTFADSSRHLVDLLRELDKKQVFFCSLKEEIDTRKPINHTFLDLVQFFVDFQSDTISQKTKIGMSEAREKGIVSGRPRKSEKNVQIAIGMYESKKCSLADIKEKTGISKSTLYRYLEN